MGLRLTQAKSLLTADLTPSEVAVAVGFYDYAHFSRAFFRSMRVLPTDYQKNSKIYIVHRRGMGIPIR